MKPEFNTKGTIITGGGFDPGEVGTEGWLNSTHTLLKVYVQPLGFFLHTQSCNVAQDTLLLLLLTGCYSRELTQLLQRSYTGSQSYSKV